MSCIGRFRRGHVQVDTIPNNSPLTFNFTALPAQSSINATTMFRVQACSGTVFVNQVGPLCVSGCVWVRGVLCAAPPLHGR
jgi:hypothetical protein